MAARGPAVAIVGARAATPYARRVAFDVAQACARAGVCVVSGLARGVDAAAHAGRSPARRPDHRGAGHGRRRGLSRRSTPTSTPRSARRARSSPRCRRARRRGAATSRRATACSPRSCDGVVLVQADEASGAHHTVRAALAGGAWAEVAPWPLDDARFAGNAAWLARGDERVTPLRRFATPRHAGARARADAAARIEARPARLAAALGARARTLDELARRAGLAPGEAAVAALELELAGRALRLPGDRYRRSPGMTAPRVRLAHRLEYLAVRGLAFVAGLLGAARRAARWERWLGGLAGAIGIRRAVAAANLARAFPEKSAKERAAILREAYAHAGMDGRRTPARRAHGRRRTRRAASPRCAASSTSRPPARAGAGLVMVAGHFGASELMALAVARGRTSGALLRARADATRWSIDSLIARRRALGVGIVGHGGRGVREALTLLRRGECVCVIADQDAGRDGVFVPFFGTPASTPPGPAEFALRAGTPILFGAMHRTAGGRLRRRPRGAARSLPVGLDHAAAVRELTGQHAAALERVVRAHPAQWLWTHRRWKTRRLPRPRRRPGRPRRARRRRRGCSCSRRSGPAAARAAADSTAEPAAAPLPESTFDGAGSTVFPLERARVRRLFEDVRIRRAGRRLGDRRRRVVRGRRGAGDRGLRAARLPREPRRRERLERRARHAARSRGHGRRPAHGGRGPAGQRRAGSGPRRHRAHPPLQRAVRRRGEARVRLVYRIGESRTDGGEPLLFYYRNPGSLWDGESPKSTVRVELGDAVGGRPGHRLAAPARLPALRLERDLASPGGGGTRRHRARRAPARRSARGRSPTAGRGRSGSALEAREEWFERLTANEIRYFIAWLAVRRGAAAPAEGPGSSLAAEPWAKPHARLPRGEAVGRRAPPARPPARAPGSLGAGAHPVRRGTAVPARRRAGLRSGRTATGAAHCRTRARVAAGPGTPSPGFGVACARAARNHLLHNR